MNMENKRGIRWAIFRLFGPLEVKNLVNYIDEIQEAAGADDIVIWPVREYPLNIQLSTANAPQEPIVFPTMAQLTAFQSGLNYGVHILGGSTAEMSEEDFKAHNEMLNKATHGGGSGRNN